MIYELLTSKNFNLNSLDKFIRTQEVKKVYRKIDGEYKIIDCCYVDDWSIEKKHSVAREISSDDYITFLAIDDKEIAGFISLKKEKYNQYMILDVIQVSAPYRGRKIGKELFELSKKEAIKSNREVLYISVYPY